MIKVKESDEELRRCREEHKLPWQKKLVFILQVLKDEDFTSWANLRSRLKEEFGSGSILPTMQKWMERYENEGLVGALNPSVKRIHPGLIKESLEMLKAIAKQEPSTYTKGVLHAFWLVKAGEADSLAELGRLLNAAFPTEAESSYQGRVLLGWFDRYEEMGLEDFLKLKSLPGHGSGIKSINELNVDSDRLQQRLEGEDSPNVKRLLSTLLVMTTNVVLTGIREQTGISTPTLLAWRKQINKLVGERGQEDGLEEFIRIHQPRKIERLKDGKYRWEWRLPKAHRTEVLKYAKTRGMTDNHACTLLIKKGVEIISGGGDRAIGVPGAIAKKQYRCTTMETFTSQVNAVRYRGESDQDLMRRVVAIALNRGESL